MSGPGDQFNIQQGSGLTPAIRVFGSSGSTGSLHNLSDWAEGLPDRDAAERQLRRRGGQLRRGHDAGRRAGVGGRDLGSDHQRDPSRAGDDHPAVHRPRPRHALGVRRHASAATVMSYSPSSDGATHGHGRDNGRTTATESDDAQHEHHHKVDVHVHRQQRPVMEPSARRTGNGPDQAIGHARTTVGSQGTSDEGQAEQHPGLLVPIHTSERSSRKDSTPRDHRKNGGIPEHRHTSSVDKFTGSSTTDRPADLHDDQAQRRRLGRRHRHAATLRTNPPTQIPSPSTGGRSSSPACRGPRTTRCASTTRTVRLRSAARCLESTTAATRPATRTSTTRPASRTSTGSSDWPSISPTTSLCVPGY